MRYTEARLGRIGDILLNDLDKDTVDFRPNYDGSESEPSVLPAKLPNLLLNGQMGIAVGMATSIPTHNLSEIVDATVELISNPEAKLEDLMKYVKGPDFPTGAVVYGGTPMIQAYRTGRGSVTMRAVAEIVETKRGRHQIVVSEIPYNVNKASLIEKIADLVKEKKITTIADLRDESARGTVKIVIDLKKDAYPKKVLNQLYKLTPLQSNFHYNMLALIDGVQTKKMRRDEVRDLFGMVLQDTWLFSGTIMENLKYGAKKISDEDVYEAAKLVGVDHFIRSLPNGYQTVISEDSDNISAGEKQLMTITRAVISKPTMMILDEATSNVDTRTEQLIQDAFSKLTKGRTSFVIAHRLSTIRKADLILVMREGNIIEQGNHKELIAKNGFYAELYNSQFSEDV